MEAVKVAKGEVIFQNGEASDYAYLIEKGMVKLDKEGDESLELIAGDLFGEDGLVYHENRDETATAITTTILKVISRDDFAKLFDKSPAEMQKLVSNLVEKKESAHKVVSATPVASEDNTSTNQAPSSSELGNFANALNKTTSLLTDRCEQLEKQMKDFAGITGEEEESEEDLLTTDLKNKIDFGPIQPLLDDDDVNDILINTHNQVYVERASGKLEETGVRFKSEKEVLALGDKIVKAVGRKIRRDRPIVDARLPDGSRVNIIAPPLSVDGTSISIRKFSKKLLTLDVMKEQGNISERVGEFLKIVAKSRMNVVISGGTGSGKTTLLNALTQHISHEERIVTIEDAAELQLQQPHVVRLETKPLSSGIHRNEEVSTRELVKNSLRMRPDRIIVGEVRGPEAFDMLQAMNTGHEGSLTTVHANHPRDCLSRMENMIGMANLGIPINSVRHQIASAIHLIVQVSRMRDGKRRVVNVTEIVGMEGNVITLQELFVFVPEAEDDDGNLIGTFKWTNIMPRFLRRVAYYGQEKRLAEILGIKLPKISNTKVKGM